MNTCIQHLPQKVYVVVVVALNLSFAFKKAWGALVFEVGYYPHKKISWN